MMWILRPWPGFFQPKGVNQSVPKAEFSRTSEQHFLLLQLRTSLKLHYLNVVFFPDNSKWPFMSVSQQLLGKVQGKCNISVPGPKSDLKTQEVSAVGAILRLE